jgi:hypothetical protein
MDKVTLKSIQKNIETINDTVWYDKELDQLIHVLVDHDSSIWAPIEVLIYLDETRGYLLSKKSAWLWIKQCVYLGKL